MHGDSFSALFCYDFLLTTGGILYVAPFSDVFLFICAGDWQTFLVKDQIINTLSFAGQEAKLKIYESTYITNFHSFCIDGIKTKIK